MRVWAVEAELEDRIKMKNLRCPECGGFWVSIIMTSAIINWDIHEGIDLIRVDSETLADASVNCNFDSCKGSKPHNAWTLQYDIIPQKERKINDREKTSN